MDHPLACAALAVVLITAPLTYRAAGEPPTAAPYRTPVSEADLKDWLENMIVYHGYNDAEVVEATGLSMKQVAEARARLNLTPNSRPARSSDDPLLVLPYPGGRHPRIGFQDGAVWPQRESKISVFTPWQSGGPASYVVVDVPEAIWSNLGLTYLAHTHVPTVWDRQGVTLERLEWNRRPDGTLDIARRLPNGIEFTTRIIPTKEDVRMELTLTNGTAQKLTDLRVQMCAMLKGAAGFTAQTNENKVFRGPFAAVRSDEGNRWIILAFKPVHRTWGNDKCPCLHSDPKFPDCEPGQTVKITGRLSFYEGTDIDAELDRLGRKP